jgi:hypothetical protein
VSAQVVKVPSKEGIADSGAPKVLPKKPPEMLKAAKSVKKKMKKRTKNSAGKQNFDHGSD